MKELYINVNKKEAYETSEKAKNLYQVYISKEPWHSLEQLYEYNERKPHLEDKDFSLVYDKYLLEKLSPESKTSDYYTDLFRAESIDAYYINNGFTLGEDYIYIISLYDIAKKKIEGIPLKIKAFDLILDRFLKRSKYMLINKTTDTSPPLLIELDAIKIANNYY